MHLHPASSPPPPPDLADLLLTLGHGDSGFGGTSFGRGESALDDFLASCRAGENPETCLPGLVPQFVFFLLDDQHHTVGMLRIRPHLNDHLLLSGGHIGYYIHPNHRRQGHAKAALQLALPFLRARGVPRALITIDPTNTPSIRTALACGATLDPTPNPSHPPVNRYWITL